MDRRADALGWRKEDLMNIASDVIRHLRDFPLGLTGILRACVAVVGLSEVLSGIGELFGDSGLEHHPDVSRDCETCRERAGCPRAS